MAISDQTVADIARQLAGKTQTQYAKRHEYNDRHDAAQERTEIIDLAHSTGDMREQEIADTQYDTDQGALPCPCRSQGTEYKG